IGTGGEKLLALADQHQRIDIAVRLEIGDQLLQRPQAVAGPGIGRRIADGHQRRMAAPLELEIGVIAHWIASVAPSINMRRPMMTRMISLVPSRIWCTRVSRT